MATSHSFGVVPITCHVWNGDRTELALSQNDENVQIYGCVNGQWKLKHTLVGHNQRVTGIDWSKRSNSIVSCAADRNAYVWVCQANGQWKPILVLLRINRAATCVKWSPCEDKFLVGSGARILSVCYFEKENDWWVSKHIKKPIRSTITCIDFHPNNCLVACGSSDFKTRIFSGYIKEVEDKPEQTCWGKKMSFSNLMAEFSSNSGGWVQSVAFSRTGDKLLWVSQNSTVHIVDGAVDPTRVISIYTNFLPFTCCMWLTEASFVAAGHGYTPIAYNYENGEIKFSANLDSNKKTVTTKFKAMDHFRSMDKKGGSVDENSTVLVSRHQNTITDIVAYNRNSNNDVDNFTSSSVDGQILNWGPMKSLEQSIASLRII